MVAWILTAIELTTSMALVISYWRILAQIGQGLSSNAK